MANFTNFSFPTNISFGAGVIEMLPSILKEHKLNRPLIVTDKIVSQLPFFAPIKQLLTQNNILCEVFDDFSGNPVESHVISGVKAYREFNADSLILLGGGAALDVGKAIALLAHHPHKLFDYEDNDACKPVDQKIPFMVAIPTTAGTGSEVGRSSVISCDDTKAKKIIFSPRLLPPKVLLDPSLTLDLPPPITAATGVDALTHLVEAYVTKSYHPLCEGIALKGVSLINQSLVAAYREPQNIEARSAMLMASMMGAISFQKGLGAVHSAAHALSTCFDLHHGLANALMIEPVCAFNLESALEKYGDLGRTVGILSADNAIAANGFLVWLKNLKKDLGLSSGAATYGVKITDRLIDVAIHDVCHGSNPRPVTAADFKMLFEKAL